jgi:hypothetical protein
MTIWAFEYGAFLKVHSNRVDPSAVSLAPLLRYEPSCDQRCA